MMLMRAPTGDLRALVWSTRLTRLPVGEARKSAWNPGELRRGQETWIVDELRRLAASQAGETLAGDLARETRLPEGEARKSAGNPGKTRAGDLRSLARRTRVSVGGACKSAASAGELGRRQGPRTVDASILRRPERF